MNTAEHARGTTPEGTGNEEQAAAWVRQMFSTVAPKYDRLNHLLSFNIDRRWRRRLLERVRPILTRPGVMVVDLCCGTGDVLIELQAAARVPLLGSDFCHPMLTAAEKKVESAGLSSRLFESDALMLPLRSDSADLVTIAFGFRNLANYEAGLAELFRVVKPGGMIAILEFSHPRGLLMRASYGFYSKAVLPMIGAAVSGSRDAYTYLPDSIRKFPRAGTLAQMMEDAGFNHVSYELLTSGIAALHIGRK